MKLPPPSFARLTAAPRRQSGFTLVELMISMVIGLFIVLALLTLLINVNRNNSEMTKSNRVIENGRFALQLLDSDIAHVGFWDGLVPQFDDLTFSGIPGDVPTAVPDPCLAYASWDAAYRTNVIGIPVQAYEIPATVPSPTVPVCATRVVNPQPSTDVLMVRHADTCAVGDPGCPTLTASDVYINVARCFDPTVNPTTTTYTLGTTADTAPTPLFRGECVTPAKPFKYVSNLYYVRNYAVNPGDGVPTLMRSQFENGVQQPAQALIEGIEGFRVEFGIDSLSDSGSAVTTATIAWADSTNLNSPTNRGDGIPDDQGGGSAYVRCVSAGTAPCTLDRLRNTVAVKLYVLVRSENRTAGYTDTKSYCLASSCPTAGDRMGPFNDGFKRHLFTQTVRLVNIATRRETP